jgi:hypothetical protein
MFPLRRQCGMINGVGMWSPTGKPMARKLRPVWGDIPAKGWRIIAHGQGRGLLLPGWEVVTLSSPGPTSFCDQHKFFATLAAVL